VTLVDRFIDGRLEYSLEWDDFVSWPNDYPRIEAIRDRVATLEPFFVAKDPGRRSKAIEALLAERNGAASLAIPSRHFERPSS
jgi:hypothetical protein